MTAIVRAAHSSSFKGISGPLRLALLGSTALVGSALIAGHANAQALPDLANAGGAGVTFTGPGGGAPNDAMNVDLNGASRILDFNSYNIAAGNSANYTTSVPAATDLVAVNRVITGGGASMIDGNINAAAGISVWLINQEGISYNGNAMMSGGSLMLSTLDFADTVDGAFRTAFAAPGAATGANFRFAGGSTSPIVIGGNLNVSGSIVAVGQQIATTGALSSDNGSIVLVAASDVTFTNGLGNPLSFTVGAGTALGGGVNVLNNLTGRSVVVAGGMQDNLTAALLNVGPSAILTATAINGTVTLATASTGSGVTITNGAGAGPSITMNGVLTATGPDGDVIVNSASDIGGVGGLIVAGRGVAIDAAGDIAVSGGGYIAASGALTVNAGSDAVLGGLRAGTDIEVTAGDSATLMGTVNAGDRFDLSSGGNASIDGEIIAGGDVSLTVLGDTAIVNTITAGGSYTLAGTRDLDQTANVSAAGDVTIGVLRDAVVSGLNAANGGALTIDVGGNATLGALTAAGDITVEAGGFAAINGAANAGNDLLVTSGGDTTLNGAVTTGRDVALSVGGDTFVSAAVVAGRDFLVTDTGNYTQVGAVTARRNVELTIDNDAAVPGSLTASSGSVDAAVDGNAAFAAITAGTDITVSSVGTGDFTGNLIAGGDVELTAGPSLQVRADVSSGDDYLLTAGTITLGAAAESPVQAAARRVFINALTGDIVGLGGLVVRSAADGAGFGNLELQANAGEVRFGIDTALSAGVTGARTDAVITSAPGILLGNVAAARLYTAGDPALSRLSASGSIVAGNLDIDNALTIVSTTGSVTTRAVSINAPGAALEIYAGVDATSSGRLGTNGGNVFVSAGRNVRLSLGAATALAGATPATGAIGLQAGGTINAGPLLAGGDVAARAAGTITVSTVRAGDDIDFASTSGDVSLLDGEATGTGGLTALIFTGAPGTPGAIGFGLEDPQLGLSNISLRSAAGDVLSGGQLTTRNGDIVVNAGLDASLARAEAAGGAIAVRAGRDVVRAASLTSTNGDITVGAGRNARLGTLTASDDIDIDVAGSLDWTELRLTGGADSARFTDVTTGTAGDVGGVTFSPLADLALTGNVVRISAGSVGSSAATTTGLIAQNVGANGFSADAATGDIHIGSVIAAGDISVTADQGSVTGLPTGYAAAGGGSISGSVGTVLLGIGTSGVIGSITADTVRTTGSADTLRIGTISATTVNLSAVQTLDVGTVTASGDVDLATTGGSAAVWGFEILTPGTLLANDGDGIDDFGTANLTSNANNGRITVSAVNGIAQLGLLQAGSGVNTAGIDQITVAARALTIGQAAALNGSLVVIASDGLLSLDSAFAREHVSLVKRNDDGTSAGSPATTDILKVGAVTGTGGSITAGFGADIRSETSLIVNQITAQGNDPLDADILVTAAGDMLVNSATSTLGSIGLYGGTSIHGNVGTTVPGMLWAAGDIAIRADGDVQYGSITAGDDVDITSTNGNLNVRYIASTGTGLTGTSVTFSGLAGEDASLAVAAGEETALSRSTIRLRAETGNIFSNVPGAIRTQGGGEVLVNAAGSVNLQTITADAGSIGILAGSLSATQLTASEDIGVRTLGGTTLGSAIAGDDIDIFSGSLTLADATATGLASGMTSVPLTGTPGAAGAIGIASLEDPQLAGSSIRLRSLSTISATGTIETQNAGEIFVNAAADVDLNRVTARFGSIGVLAGGDVLAASLTAAGDIGVVGGVSGGTLGLVSVTATAGDDIDVTAVTGDLVIGASSTGAAAPDGRSVAFTGVPGSAAAVGVVGTEDAAHLDSSIRAAAMAGDVTASSLVTSGVGNVFVSASGNAAVTSASAAIGSIGILAGQAATATSLTASHDIFIQARTGVTVDTATAGDDIDMTALGGDLLLNLGTSRGVTAADGTSVVIGGAPGQPGALGIAGSEDAQLGGGAIRLLAADGDIVSHTPALTSTLRTQGLGNILVNASGDVTVDIVDAANGSVALLAGGQVTAARLTASRDIGVQAGLGIAVTSATAGDDIDMTALNGDLALINGTSTGTGIGGSSVVFAAPGTAGAVAIASTEAAPFNAATIRLRSQVGNVTSSALRTQGAGEIFVNAFANASVTLAQAANGSVGLLAGGDVTATTLTARRDIAVSAGRDALVSTASAGDDIDIVAGRDIRLTSAASLATANTGGTSVIFGTAGTADAVSLSPVGGEDTQLTAATIRLRAAGGLITGRAASPAGTTLSTAGGDILLNALTDVTVLGANAGGGSIGVLAGGEVTAATLTARRDIAVQGRGNVTIIAATAGDDIDAVSLTGSLVLTDAAATGLGAGGTSVAFTGAPGTAGAINTAAAEDAQLSGSTIRLRAAAGNVSSTGTLRTQASGDVLVNASGNAALAAVDAASGSVGVLAGGQVTATSLTARRDVGVQAGTGMTIANAAAGDDIDLVALSGNVSLANGTASAASGTSGTSVVYTAPAGTANAVGIGAEDAQLSGSTIRLRAATGDVASTGTLTATGAGEVLVNAGRDAALATVNAASGSIGVLAGRQVTAASLTASRDIGVQAGTGIAVTNATAGDDIDMAALGGNLALTNGTSTGAGSGGTALTFGTAGQAGALAIGTEDTQLTAATIRLRSQAGDVTSTGTLAVRGTGNLLVGAANAVTLNAATVAAGSLGAQAGGQVTATSLTASRDISVEAGTGIAVTNATAGDDIDMAALGGNLALANGTSTGAAGAGGTALTFAAAGTAGAVAVTSGEDAQMGGAAIRLRAANGNVTSTGTLHAQGTGDVLVNARRDVTLAATTASAGSVALLAGGSLTAGTTTASEDVAVRAATTATLASTAAGDDIEITASGLVTTGAGTIRGPATGLDARHAVFDTAQAGQAGGITLAPGDTRGPKGLPSGSALAGANNGRNITIEAANVDVQGVLDATTAGRITLRNTGTGPTLLGDGTVTTGGGFALSDAELGRLRTGTLVVDSGSRALELAAMTIGADTGTTDTRFLTTGAAEITGRITVAGTADRTLQIGGLLGELGDDAATVPLAASLAARIDRASRPGIDAGAAHVDLRAGRILFGTSAMVDEYIGLTNDQIADIVANPTSKLYAEVAAKQLGVFLTARRMTVGYQNFALFQNTDAAGSGGVAINSPANSPQELTDLALRLVSTGQGGNNSFAMFGVVNNFSGTPAALLPNEAVEIVNPTGDPNDFRVTRANSRINGCVIGAPDRGCLATDIPQPNFNLYDERKVALFDVDDEQTIAISPLIGRGNDGLIVNVADAPVGIDTIECRPEDTNCPAKEDK